MRIEGAKAIKSRLAAKPSKNGRQEGWRLAVKNGRD